MEAGIQLHLPTFKDYPLPHLLKLGRLASSGGFEQVWVTDNLTHRNSFVVLTALAMSIPVKLGTAVMVQYFHNPVDVADTVAALSELMEGRELSIGISRGSGNTPHEVNIVKPISMLRETAQSLKRLLAGEEVRFEDYPTLASYFNLIMDWPIKLGFAPASPVRLYCGGNAPLSLDVGARFMDGIVFGGTLLAAHKTGRLSKLLSTAETTAKEAGRPEALRKIAEIKISIDRDRETAREFVKPSVAGRMLSLRGRGYTDEDFQTLGIDPSGVDCIEQAHNAGTPRNKLTGLVTDTMIDSIFVAGDPDYCRERMVEVGSMAAAHGFHQLMFSELGPDADAALGLLSDAVLPVVR